MIVIHIITFFVIKEIKIFQDKIIRHNLRKRYNNKNRINMNKEQLDKWKENLYIKQIELEKEKKELDKYLLFLNIAEKIDFFKSNFDGDRIINIIINYSEGNKCYMINILNGTINGQKRMLDQIELQNLGLNPFFIPLSLKYYNIDRQLTIVKREDQFSNSIDDFLNKILQNEILVKEYKMMMLEKTLEEKPQLMTGMKHKI